MENIMMDNSSLAGDATVFTNPNINNSSIINNDSVKFEGADAGRSPRKKTEISGYRLA